MDQKLIPGWYGKIPALGDFVSKRLSNDFIQPWDAWLQESLTASRSQLGQNWLELYLNCPIWRFILMQNLCGDNICAGILMPSVDKVGRYFPLTIALQFEVRPGIFQAIVNAQNWFAELEQLALKSLDTDFSPKELDFNLSKLPFPETKIKPPIISAQDFILWWESNSHTSSGLNKKAKLSAFDEIPAFFTNMMEYQFTKSGSHKSIWWREFLTSKEIHLQCFSGLPAIDHFIALLNDSDTVQDNKQ